MTFVRFPSFCQMAGTLSTLFNKQSKATSAPSSSMTLELELFSIRCPSNPCSTEPCTNSTIATNSFVPPVIRPINCACASTHAGATWRALESSKNSSSSIETTRLRAMRTPTTSATSTASASATADIPCGFTATASDSPICAKTTPPMPPEHHIVKVTEPHGTTSTGRLTSDRQCAARRASSCLAISFLCCCSFSRLIRSSSVMTRPLARFFSSPNHSSSKRSATA
mmetsp:Transcript_7255/g.15082  ORF Transcript_7255/g.15082 Transcript_7255/m.15082 type:complete len:226 (-) Transcript_7255:437-1114(-)